MDDGPCASLRATWPSSPSPHGPLNMQRLTVLSMIYRLWAGIRLKDAIC